MTATAGAAAAANRILRREFDGTSFFFSHAVADGPSLSRELRNVSKRLEKRWDGRFRVIRCSNEARCIRVQTAVLQFDNGRTMTRISPTTTAVCAAIFAALVAVSARAQTSSSSSVAKETANTVSKDDRAFATKLTEAGMAEVEAAKAAQKKAQLPEVKQFADRMVQEHTKANEEVAQIASRKDIKVPDKLDKTGEQELDQLDKRSGSDFDAEYTKRQVSDHQKAVKAFEKEAKSGKDADLKRFATDTLPKLEEHLKLAQAAQAATKAHAGKEPTSAGSQPAK